MYFYKSLLTSLIVHGLTGSMYGCDVLDPLVSSGHIVDASAASKLCAGWPFIMKGSVSLFYSYIPNVEYNNNIQ